MHAHSIKLIIYYIIVLMMALLLLLLFFYIIVLLLIIAHRQTGIPGILAYWHTWLLAQYIIQ